MKIASYNIYEGGVGRIDPIAEVLRQLAADVVILPEAFHREEFHKLAVRLKMDAFLAINPVRPDHGAVGLLSRLPIREAVNQTALDSRLTRAAFRATLDLPTGPLTIIGLHLHARETLADEAERLKEIPAILDMAKPYRERNEAHVLAGDFNAHHPEQIIDVAKLRAKTRERIAPQGNTIPREAIRMILEAGYWDAHALRHAPADFGTSLTTTHPALRVDYLFVPGLLRDKVLRCDYPRPAGDAGIARFASDHYPLLAELAL